MVILNMTIVITNYDNTNDGNTTNGNNHHYYHE